MAIPCVGLFNELDTRLGVFYAIASFFGFAFGSVYARFQDCTWSLLPSGADIANLMGFAAMAKLAGVGIGNFIAGLILDHYVSQTETYEFRGYIVMCTFCAVVVGAAGGLAWTVGRTALEAEEAASKMSKGAASPLSLGSRESCHTAESGANRAG